MYTPRHNTSSKIPLPNAVITKPIATNTLILGYTVPEEILKMNAISAGNIIKGISFIFNLRGELNSLIFLIPISLAENNSPQNIQ